MAVVSDTQLVTGSGDESVKVRTSSYNRRKMTYLVGSYGEFQETEYRSSNIRLKLAPVVYYL
jgi:hypothetical protein